MDNTAVESRRKYIEAWNKTMLDIWQERIYRLRVMRTGALWRSPISMPVRADGRFLDVSLSQSFIEYGLWQDLGVGREVPHGNSGDIGREKKRQRKKWFSTKYYSSVMNLRDFMAESLGDEYVGMFANLDSDDQRNNTSFYRRKGYV